ncbi:MAG: class I SAM-dependent methyltransferase [Lentisphaerales bacterium]|nr:class I SAM-dependent methyltransferase [Lentisphaerales bacterium]
MYDLLGTVCFLGKLHASQKKQLKHFPKQVKNILILGGGTGKFLVDLASQIDFESLTYLDISPKMISQARSKVIKEIPQLLPKINFICAPASDLPDQTYELIITHYFMDCFQQKDFELLALKLRNMLAPNGLWSMVDFYNESNSSSRSLLIRFLYLFFRVSCNLNVRKLPEFDAWFHRHMHCQHSQKLLNGLLKASLYKKI